MDVMFVHIGLGTIWALLLFAHCLADYPLQGDFLARGKNHLAPIPGVPSWIALAAHATIHAGLVGMCTGSALLAFLEYAAHSAIDYAKCAGRFGDGERAFTIDQGLHIVCKVVWVTLIGMGVR